MATVTRHYGIPGPVPFVDVELDVDNHLFVDPHVIRLRRSSTPYADDAVQCIDTFIDTVLACVVSPPGSPARRIGERLLQRFNEPRETRLGMSRAGIDGHGAAEFLGSEIWRALTQDADALVEVGVLGRLEHLPLFVSRIDRDITSDITTRLIFGPLTDFTAAMVARYPQFTAAGHRTQIFDRQVWDPVDMVWKHRRVQLPVAGKKALVLVPKGWVRRWLLMSAGRYFEVGVLGFAQDEQTTEVDGRLLRPTKDRLKKDPNLSRGRDTITRVTLQAHTERDRDLVAGFTGFVDERFEPGQIDAA